MPLAHRSVLALDVGTKRIGVAVASLVARLPQPLVTLAWDDKFFPALADIIETEGVASIVVGWPRGLQGQLTDQTRAVEAFTAELRHQLALPIHLQDEALTSQKAETELGARGKTYDRTAIDALAATYILEDYLGEHLEQA